MQADTSTPDPRIIVALDFPDAATTLTLAQRLDPGLCRVKVGMELFTAACPALVERGFRVFLDLKFHDIPNTVAAAVKIAARLGVWMVDVHALGGEAMLHAARDALEAAAQRPLLVAGTVLTSLAEPDLAAVGLQGTVEQNVLRLARLAQRCGLDGVVCSGQEAPVLRRELGREFVLVTPGIRLAGSAGDDQARVLTPVEALRLGTDYLVIGRPITQSPEPLRTLHEISDSIRQQP